MSKSKLHQLGTHRTRRRRFLKGAAAVAGTAALSGWRSKSGRAQAQGTLDILAWPGWADPALVGPFEEEHNTKVRIKEFTTPDEMLALISSSPRGTFDVVDADAEYVQMLAAGGFLEKHDPADYHFDDFWPEFQKWPQHWIDGDLYSVIVRFGYLGIGYNTEAFRPKDLTSYGMLWREELKGKVGFYDWYLPSMGVLSLYNGNRDPYDLNKAQFDKLKETLFSLRPTQVIGFYTMADTFAALTKRQALLIPGLGEWITLNLRKDGVPVDTYIPDEGGLQWTESLSIVKGTKNSELAKKFIQYMTSPEGQLRVALKPDNQNYIVSIKGWELLNERYPSEANWLRHRLDQRNVMDEHREGKIVPRKLPVQQSIEEWAEVWTEFKSL